MAKKIIDINCDLGESYGFMKVGNDEAIFPYITSCNIACGFHGGDASVIENTLLLAKKYGTRIGAHPSYPDATGFGRRKMDLKSSDLKALIKYQVSAIKGMAESLGLSLKYVKPHGALYNAAADSEEESTIIVEATAEIDASLRIMGLAGSIMEDVASKYKMAFISEGFADRKYDDNARLVPRKVSGSVIEDPDEAAHQVLTIVRDNHVFSISGKRIKLSPDSICIHGDNPNAVSIIQAIRNLLSENKISIGRDKP